MAQSLKCSHCGAPLPDTQASTIRCNFCGTTNRLQPTVGQTQVREAVRQILNERAQPPPPRPQPNPTAPIAIIGALVAVGISAALFVEFTFGPKAPPPSRRSTPVPVVAPPMPPEPFVPPTPPAPPKQWGPLGAITRDEHGDLLAVFGSTLVKLDAATLTPRWQTPFSRGYGNYVIIVPRGDWVAVTTDNIVSFFEADSGAKTNDFQFKHGGILEGACAAGKTQLLIDVLGEGVVRYDAATGKKAASGPSCALKDKLACPSSQRCGWSRFQNADYDCRYAVHAGKDVFRSCETEDGKKRKVIISTGTKKWEHETDETVETYFGVVDDMVLIGGYRAVVALDAATGDERWRTGASQSAVVADGSTLYFASEGTLVAVDAKSGEELRRLRPPD
jgi:putative pyrroloquinoline-quinone binding quinoprotein